MEDDAYRRDQMKRHTAASNAAEATWNMVSADQQDYRAQIEEAFERDRAEQARLAKIHRDHEIRQLARDLLLAAVGSGYREVNMADMAAIHKVARDFYATTETEAP